MVLLFMLTMIKRNAARQLFSFPSVSFITLIFSDAYSGTGYRSHKAGNSWRY